eukprot:6595201-Pyramimonas_sp.AAC.2
MPARIYSVGVEPFQRRARRRPWRAPRARERGASADLENLCGPPSQPYIFSRSQRTLRWATPLCCAERVGSPPT